jgi:excisionase family DNA binding protein
LRTVARSAQDRLKAEREAESAILAAAIAAAVAAAMEHWMKAESSAAQGVLDRDAAQTMPTADSAGVLSAALPANRLAYRVSDVMDALGIGRNLVYDLINSGQLKHVKAGRATLVPRSALEKFLAGEAQ